MKNYLVYSIHCSDDYPKLISAHKSEQNAKKKVESLTTAELERVSNCSDCVSTGVGSMPEPPHECIYTHVAIDLED
ncbi:hypothetical protein [Brevibacillus laterosporus]|uniref:Uncharacterized protein n=1 Tax=Brevibacillus laterosporus TaxID=1465 RepID=A0AAP8QHD0_BRELA|nr:hypothetical protein [Brevibacillus laterosporus]PPB12950.1 hypothetical protein C4A77_00765 [Brevibacillus laterosporus]